jgi:hypothetical protein
MSNKRILLLLLKFFGFFLCMVHLIVFFHEIGHVIGCLFTSSKVIDITILFYKIYPNFELTTQSCMNNDIMGCTQCVVYPDHLEVYNKGVIMILAPLFTTFISLINSFYVTEKRKVKPINILLFYPETMIQTVYKESEFIRGLTMILKNKLSVDIILTFSFVIPLFIYVFTYLEIKKNNDNIENYNNVSDLTTELQEIDIE